MYCITDWDVNFEVDSNGRRWKTGSQFFSGPLPYVRCPARRDWPVRLLHIERQLGDQVYMILGMFEKLVSVVGSEPRTLREGGVIRNSRQEPASLSDIAMMLLVDEERAKWALDILCSPSVEWVAVAPEEGLLEETEDAAGNGGSQQETAKPAKNSESRGNPQETASVKVISDQISKSCHNSNTEKGPRIVRFHDLTSRGDHDARPDVRCYEILGKILQPADSDSHSALANFVQWLAQNHKRAGPDRYNQVITLARDCVNGKCPMAVFMSRVKQEWEYAPPSRKQARS